MVGHRPQYAVPQVVVVYSIFVPFVREIDMDLLDEQE